MNRTVLYPGLGLSFSLVAQICRPGIPEDHQRPTGPSPTRQLLHLSPHLHVVLHIVVAGRDLGEQIPAIPTDAHDIDPVGIRIDVLPAGISVRRRKQQVTESRIARVLMLPQKLGADGQPDLGPQSVPTP